MLLKLGDRTSKNLGFAYEQVSGVSYGEETITESNLLDLKRLNPTQIRIETFSKSVESKKTGADWEWHIAGKTNTLKMRVQAKRITRDGKIKGLKQQGKNALLPQICLLLKSAKLTGRMPLYCFYSAEKHRTVWNASASSAPSFKGFETGCLLVDAHTVKSKMPKNLSEIEADTWPWHFLWSNNLFERSINIFEKRFAQTHPEFELHENFKTLPPVGVVKDFPFPTIDQLNGRTAITSSFAGLVATSGYSIDHEIQVAREEQRDISRILYMDVKEPDLMHWRFR
ncbi:DUF6615 family protein [Litoreibacter janthinus]|uniref:Uncharacterized protein n=1 Tax=Litoreibacter janthinus TaxID=670154 RepID=A0A1I6GG74_9RHOB|nr:DUF6615 family protein [Litoreibacter janthinus]SFR41205.1 hypothetical protein SAMN04488002_1432 [Litoreibacter janthinus]